MNRNGTVVFCTAIILVAIIAVYWQLRERLNDLQLCSDRALMKPAQKDGRDRFCSKHPIGFRPSYVSDAIKTDS